MEGILCLKENNEKDLKKKDHLKEMVFFKREKIVAYLFKDVSLIRYKNSKERKAKENNSYVK